MMHSSGFSCSYRPVFRVDFVPPHGDKRRKLVLWSFLKRKPKERTKGQPYANAKHTRMVTEGKTASMVYLHPTKGWRKRFVAGF